MMPPIILKIEPKIGKDSLKRSATMQFMLT